MTWKDLDKYWLTQFCMKKNFFSVVSFRDCFITFQGQPRMSWKFGFTDFQWRSFIWNKKIGGVEFFESMTMFDGAVDRLLKRETDDLCISDHCSKREIKGSTPYIWFNILLFFRFTGTAFAHFQLLRSFLAIICW